MDTMETLMILDYVPKGMEPRDVQRALLEQVEAAWKTSDVIVINAPVATGKSLIATTIANWVEAEHQLSSAIVTPTNLLVDQYASEFSELSVLHKKDAYVCKRSSEKLKCERMKLEANLGHYCRDCCMTKARRTATTTSKLVCNTWIYQSNRLYKPVVIFDEAHNLVDHIRGINSKVKWKHDLGYPDWIRTYGDLCNWMKDKGYDEMLKELGFESRVKYLVEVARKPYGKSRKFKECLNFLPLDVSNARPLLWPPAKVGKLILMSATLSRKDVEYLGLDRRRVSYLESSSPILAQRRPILFEPIGYMSVKSQDANLTKLAEQLRSYLRKHVGQRGLIHATYGLARKLRQLLADEPRLIWHDKSDKARKYSEFRQSEDGVLVASGMYEGIDLPLDAGRWQVIAKVPYPSLGDPVTSYLAEQDPTYYAWETAKVVIQACGRICRRMDDFGVTYIVDSSFEKLYTQNANLFPDYFRDSLQGVNHEL